MRCDNILPDYSSGRQEGVYGTMSLNYYSLIIFLSLLALLVLCILVRENGRIPDKNKRLLYLTYLLIALSAMAEWSGLQLDGVESLPSWPLRIAKCADYILTPMAGGALVRQMNLRNRWYKALIAVLTANVVFQIVGCFTGWTLQIDAHNHYTHGPLYGVYICVYLVVIALLIIEFMQYGKEFRRQNRVSLYAIMILVIAGIASQELLGSWARISYISLTLGAVLLFIHYSEFSQMTSDERLREQEIQMSTDALTGMPNRYAYSKALEAYDASDRLPERLAAFSIDINGLKAVNDMHGHAVGDELICGAAACINRVFEGTGRCFRTGGDEFIVFAELDRAQAEAALAGLAAESEHWSGAVIRQMHLAAGCALAVDHAGISAEKLVIEADNAMYAEKERYYLESGEDRRRHDAGPGKAEPAGLPDEA